MTAMRWTILTLLTFGYGIALGYGHLSLPAALTFGLLIMAGLCVRPFNHRAIIWVGHGLFILLAAALASHWLPGFFSARVIAAERFSPDAVPFSMYMNLDKPLIGFWILLACAWTVPRLSALQAARTSVLALVGTGVACMGAALALGFAGWQPKWPPHAYLWLLNNLLLVSVTEELLFRGYFQGGLQRLFKGLPHGGTVALCITALLFGLAHIGGGWQWVLLAGMAGLGYGLAYRFGGMQAAIITHFGVNLLHFSLFTYPMIDR
jgi:membrane protease YdiL (CAAX protease family)